MIQSRQDRNPSQGGAVNTDELLPDWLDEPMYEVSNVETFALTVTELVSPRFVQPDGTLS